MPRLSARTLPCTSVISFCLLLFAALSVQAQPRVEITGGDSALQNNIRAHLRVTSESCTTPLSRLRRQSPRVSTNIDNAAKALGYYQSRHRHEFVQEEECWILRIDMEPGEPVRLREVSVRILGDEQEQALFRDILRRAPAPGARLHQGDYEAFKTSIASHAIEQGYFSSRFTRSEIALVRGDNLADIRLDYSLGERYQVGEVIIRNNTRLGENVINRMLSVESGDPYSSDAMFAQRDNLNLSQFFGGINLYPDLSEAHGSALPVYLELEPRPRHVYGAGVGFTTDTGPRLRLSYTDRYVNSAGHSLSSDMSLSPIRSEADVSYILPLRDPVRERLQFRAGYLTEDTRTYESDRYTLRTNYTKQMESGWLRDIFINYQRERYVIEEAARSELTILGASLSRSKADSTVFTRRGWSLFGELKGATDSFISDTNFLQATTHAKLIHSVGDIRLLSRVEAGTTWIDQPSDLPASIRYFAGGDRSIRGYQYRALGPVNDNNEVVGGRHMVLASAEIDFPLYDSWRLAAFYDTGNAFNDFNDFDWKNTVGVGIRWLSPIGPVRVDIGHPLEDGGVRLHVTMGPDL